MSKIGLLGGYDAKRAYGLPKQEVKFIATHQGDYAYSYNGIQWVSIPSPLGVGNKFLQIIYGAGKWVALVDSGGIKTAYSNDGISWNVGMYLPIDVPDPDVNFLMSDQLIYANGVYVTGGTGQFFYSLDGINWNLGNVVLPEGFAVPVNPTSFIYNKNFFTATISNNYVLVSYDGIDWSVRNPIALTYGSSDLFYNGITYLATGDLILPDVDNNPTVTSTYLMSVYSSTTTPPYNWSGMLYSTSYASWNGYQVSTDAYQTIYGSKPIYHNYMFMEIRSDGYVFYTTNGNNWQENTLVRDLQPYRIVYGSGLYILSAGAATNGIYYSTDGFSYTLSNATTLHPFTLLAAKP